MQLPHSFVVKNFYRLFCPQVDSGKSCPLSTKWPVLLFFYSLLQAGIVTLLSLETENNSVSVSYQDLQIWLKTAFESHGQSFTLSNIHQGSMYLLHQVWWPAQGYQQPKMNWSQRKNRIAKTGNYFSNISLALKGKHFSFRVASYSHLSCFTIEVG